MFLKVNLQILQNDEVNKDFLYSVLLLFFVFFSGSTAPWGPRTPIFRSFTITLFRHTTLSRPPLDEGSARLRNLYLTA
jgi:hypothetical protein